MKKIYFLLPYYPNWIDGGLKYQTMVCNYFMKKYKEVYAFGRSVDVKHSKYKLIQLLSKLIHIIRIAIAIIHIIRIPRHSIIILNNAFFFDYSVPITLNRFWKKHIYILIVHHLVQKDRPSFLRKIFENHFIRTADMLITISKITQDELTGLFISHEKAPIMYPGLDVDFSRIPDKKHFPEKPKLLYVGSIEKRKGLIYLIEALGNLQIKNFELNIVGRINIDDYFEKLKNRIKDLDLINCVFFPGRIDKAELINYYTDSSIFVFPSLWEGYGMAVAEALAYGLPIIASRIPALEELVENGKEGFMVEPENSIKLSEAINTLLKDKNLLDEFSCNASIKAKTFPSWEETSDNIWQLVDKNFLVE